MSRVLLVLSCLLVAVSSAGCGGYDCKKSCQAMRDCGYLYNAANSTCEVTCAFGEGDRSVAIDNCGQCVDGTCDQSCFQGCVCSLQLDLSAYPGVICTP